MPPEIIELDASEGGQIFRYGIGFSALLQKPVCIKNIRKAASNPGLQRQHLAALQALSHICSAHVKGAKLNSMQITFFPQKIQESRLVANIGTAGSTSLLLQSLLLPSLKKKTSAVIVGGTDVPWSPSFYYFKEVLFPFLARFGCRFETGLVSHGFFPKGQGRISFSSTPVHSPLKTVCAIRQGTLEHIKIFSQSASLPKEVSINQATAAKSILSSLDVPFETHISSVERSRTIGSAIDCIAFFDSGYCMGVNAIGKKGKPAVDVGNEAGEKMLNEIKSKTPIDQYLADQLIPFMALADGTSTIKVSRFTEHCEYALQVAESFCNTKFDIAGAHGKAAKIVVKGNGFTP